MAESLSTEHVRLLEGIRQMLRDLSRRLEQDTNEDLLDYVVFRLGQVSQHPRPLALNRSKYASVHGGAKISGSIVYRRLKQL